MTGSDPQAPSPSPSDPIQPRRPGGSRGRSDPRYRVNSLPAHADTCDQVLEREHGSAGASPWDPGAPITMDPSDAIRESAVPQQVPENVPLGQPRGPVDGGTGGDREGLRILVVEDEPTLRSVIGQVLTLDGHEVTEATCAEEALALFRGSPFPLVITDIVMGHMSGLELLKEIRLLDPEALVVIMTSQGSLETATAALRHGAYDFLVKPFDDLFLISALAERAADRLQLQARNRILTEQLKTYAEELERLNRNLKEAADRDGLTGLLNHRYLRDAMEVELERSRRHGRVFSLVMLDVDHFKQYNDRHGHLAGDEVLRGVGRTVLETNRLTDLCARYGGEEFAVLLPETDHGGALVRAERMRRAVEEYPFAGRETQPLKKVTISLGCACYPEDGQDTTTLIARADEALYRAKQKGRNAVCRSSARATRPKAR